MIRNLGSDTGAQFPQSRPWPAMTRWRTLIALAGAATTLAASALAAPSALGAGDPIINDCLASGRLTKPYTVPELNHALSVMTASTKEYTSCHDVISQGVLTAIANHGALPGTGRGGSGGSFLPTPVIVVLVLLLLAAVTFGAVAIRRRREGPGEGSGEGPGNRESGPPTP